MQTTKRKPRLAQQIPKYFVQSVFYKLRQVKDGVDITGVKAEVSTEAQSCFKWVKSGLASPKQFTAVE